MNNKKAKISLRAHLQFLLKQKVNDRADFALHLYVKQKMLRNKQLVTVIMQANSSIWMHIKYTACLEQKTISYEKEIEGAYFRVFCCFLFISIFKAGNWRN